MLLDIIVPHYNEPWEVVKPFVDMINNQKGIDFNEFRVLIIHDGVEKFPEKYLEGPARIFQFEKEQAGVSAARNYGIDISDAKWVNFSDCDDCYSSVFALYLLFPVLRADEAYDIFWSPFWMIIGNTLKVFNEYQSVFVHNKYYRRSFLNEKDIRFCERLYMSEDSAFNAVVEKRINKDRVGKIQVHEPVYSWCRRPGSITMTPERYIHNMEGHFERNLYVLEECSKYVDGRADLMMVRTLADVYAQGSLPWIPGDPEPLLKKAAEFYKLHKITVQDVSEEDLKRIMNVSDLEAGTTDEIREKRPSFWDWLDEIEEKYV